jgi:hypothetical protein|tara:strand:- start:223 stop:417 length:195 start_codon:yes stop_codon:yes gene_type:complete
MLTFRTCAPNAEKGDFIKDTSPQNRSMGHVKEINLLTNMMKVKFPKIGKETWVVWENHGHYIVV